MLMSCRRPGRGRPRCRAGRARFAGARGARGCRWRAPSRRPGRRRGGGRRSRPSRSAAFGAGVGHGGRLSGFATGTPGGVTMVGSPCHARGAARRATRRADTGVAAQSGELALPCVVEERHGPPPLAARGGEVLRDREDGVDVGGVDGVARLSVARARRIRPKARSPSARRTRAWASSSPANCAASRMASRASRGRCSARRASAASRRPRTRTQRSSSASCAFSSRSRPAASATR